MYLSMWRSDQYKDAASVISIIISPSFDSLMWLMEIQINRRIYWNDTTESVRNLYPLMVDELAVFTVHECWLWGTPLGLSLGPVTNTVSRQSQSETGLQWDNTSYLCRVQLETTW